MTNKTYAVTVFLLVFVLIAVGGTGAFAISYERQDKIEIAQRIRSHENEIAKLRRENEELSAKIAKEENPEILNRKASARLLQPQMGSVVWAYEHFDRGRVEFPAKKGLVSFQAPVRGTERIAEQ